MAPIEWLQLLAALAVAFLCGSLVEYVVHRLMHANKLRGRIHAEHHRDRFGQGWFGEFKDYLMPGIPFIWIGFLITVPVGVGWSVGLLLYAFLAAYSHQLQHDRPELCFWMRQPVHHTHHEHQMWHHNFGILTSLWDHVFGTYKRVEWSPRRVESLRDFVRIKWF